METLIVLVVLGILILPIIGIVSFFKTQGLLRESLSEMKSDLSVISVKVVELSNLIKQLGKEERTPAMRPDKPPSPPATPVEAKKPLPVETATPSLPNNVHTAPHTSPQKQTPEQEKLKDASFHHPEPEPEVAAVDTASSSRFPKAPKPKALEDLEKALRSVWSWIIVGDENRRPGVSMEFAVASTWLLRLGIIALVVCVGYFLRWSMDKGILGPTGRVAMTVVTGLGMVVGGMFNLNKKYHLLAQGFLGGGIAFLYFSTYAAGPLYNLVSISVAFGLMVLVTLVAGVLAVRVRSQLIAILGIIGGYATPVMLSTGDANFVVLYSYLLILGIGILAISHARQWRILNYLAFVFTWLLFYGSLEQYNPERHFTIAIWFLSALFILHSAIVYYYNLVRKKTSTLLEVIHLLLNGVLYSVTSYNLIVVAHGKPWPAVMSIALAVFYIAHVFVFLKGRMHDRFMLVVLLGLAGFFTAWAVPLITEKETLTICWALLAFVFLWMGLKLQSNMLINMSMLLYLLVLGRTVALDMPRNFGILDWSARPAVEYWRSFGTRIWNFGVIIGTLFGAVRLYRRKMKVIGSLAVDSETRLPFSLLHPTLTHGIFWIGVLLLFTTLRFELIMMFSYAVQVRVPVLTALWVLLGAYMAYRFISSENVIIFTAATLVLILVVIKLFAVDFAVWNFDLSEMMYTLSPLQFFMRLIDYGLIAALILYLLRVADKNIGEYPMFLKALPTALLFLYASLEINTLFFWQMPLFRPGAISVLWALFAVSFLAIGIGRTSKPWRYTGLALFCVVVAKVFLFDLADMETIYRVIAFMIVGILLLGGSFVYIKAEREFIAKETVE